MTYDITLSATVTPAAGNLTLTGHAPTVQIFRRFEPPRWIDPAMLAQIAWRTAEWTAEIAEAVRDWLFRRRVRVVA